MSAHSDALWHVASGAASTILTVWLYGLGNKAMTISGLLVMLISVITANKLATRVDWCFNKFKMLLNLDAIVSIVAIVLSLVFKTPWVYYVTNLVLTPLFKAQNIGILRIFKIRYADADIREHRDNVRNLLGDYTTLVGYIIGVLLSWVNINPVYLLVALQLCNIANNVWYKKAWKEAKEKEATE